MPRPVQVPVFRISMTNASLLSVVYLVGSIGVELLRRGSNPRWAERASLALEAFPARTLDLLGLLEPLRVAYAQGQVGALGVRLLYGVTAVALIFALGAVVGAGMWAIAALSGAAEPPSPE